MKLLRYLASTLLVCLPLAAAAQAGDFPTKAIRLVVPFPPGGATDAAARLVAVKMSEHWGQPVLVDNRAGAGGNVGSDIVAKSPADGYTLVMGVTGSHAINTSLYSKMPYEPVTDFVAMSQVAVVPNVLVVHPSVPAKNLAELMALAKKEPGKLNYASLGNGTAAHLGMEMLKSDAGVDITHVPYKGSAPAVSDLLAGQVQMMVDGLPSALAAHQGRQAARDCAHQPAPLAVAARSADHRGDLPGLLCRRVVGPVRAQGHAAACGGQALGGGAAHPEVARRAREAGGTRRRARGLHASRIHRSRQT
jgi:tripartite-type tricarboxylate transporter receptor subunit TctC